MDESIRELFARGYKARRENQLPESRAAFLDGVRRAALEADRPSLAEAFCGLAQAEHDIGNLPAAGHHYENAAILYRELGQRERLAYALRHEADILREDNKVEDAESHYAEAETIYRELGESASLDLANTLRGLALAKEASGDQEASIALWKEARELYAKCKVEAGVQECDQRLLK